MSSPRHRSPSLLLATLLLSGAVPPAFAAIWQPLLAEPGRRMEIDRSTIKRESDDVVLARGRVVFERPLPDAVSGSAFRVLESHSRFNCKARTFATLQRVFMRDESEGLREESESDPPELPVRSGTLEDRVMRVACRPDGLDGAKEEFAEALQQVNEAGKEIAAANERRRVLTAKLGSGVGGSAAVAAASPQRVAARREAPAPAIAWGYEGAGAPDQWGSLRPDYRLCASGQRQAPIDLKDGIAVDLPPVEFDYRPSLFRVTDNGRTLKVEVGDNRVRLLGKRYTLVGLQFHHPAEVTTDGRGAAMAAHFIHRADDGRMLLIAVPLEAGPENAALQTVLDHLPLERHEPVEPPTTPLDLRALLPAQPGYFTFMGSLSTPPCTEGVQWVAMKQAVPVSPAQIAIFARLYPANARPLQAANGRLVKESR